MMDATEGAENALEQEVECPDCRKTMMQIYLNYAGSTILIDHCKECGSYWYDKGELDKVLDEDELEAILNKKMPTRTGSRFPCPRCGEDMAVKMMLEVEVDQCKNCKGVWLDRDEIGQIKAACRAGMETNRLMEFINRME